MESVNDNGVSIFDVMKFKGLCDSNGDYQIINRMYDVNMAMVNAVEGATTSYNERYARQVGIASSKDSTAWCFRR